ncbi:hypothetical protein CBR_g22098 [Chara braunii]|uniref:Protein kinase domain-containing protein n=1 Tax=Chara braunii TaxID=69332 RepID=A0A388L227_CHABU|nr:hypothetical protein CBR_g22098 [Chara braunii]|eukprot:GBG76351.1 hypothetical protein CBR_g22098 [Chara braunii]
MEFRHSQYEETGPRGYGDCPSRVPGRASVLMMMALVVTICAIAIVLRYGVNAAYGRGAVSNWHQQDSCQSAGNRSANSVRPSWHGSRVSHALQIDSLSLDEQTTFNSRFLEATDGILPTVLNADLIVKRTKVLTLTPSPVFPTTNTSSLLECRDILENLVLALNGSVLYYVRDQRCFFNMSRIPSHWLVSVRRAARMPGAGGWGAFQNDSLISYWWVFNDPDGMVLSSATVFKQDSGMEAMAYVNGMDLWYQGTTLVLGVQKLASNATLADERAMVTLLSAVNGSRRSLPLPGLVTAGMGLDPTKTNAYLVDLLDPPRVMSAEAASLLRTSASTADDDLFKPEATFPRVTGLNLSRLMVRPQGFTSDGSCLYIGDQREGNVWTVDLLARNITLAADPNLIGLEERNRGNLREIAVTRDGCNAFVADIGGQLRWMQLKAQCGEAQRVHIVARYRERGFWGLAIHEDDNQLRLYVGTNDGRLFELEINRSALHTCLPLSRPPPPNPPPPTISSSSQPPAADSPGSAQHAKRHRNLTLAVYLPVAIVAVSAILAGIMVAVFYYQRREGRKRQEGALERCGPTARDSSTSSLVGSGRGASIAHEGTMEDLLPFNVTAYPLETLAFVTGNFSADYRIGDNGAFGDVYWGDIGGREVAVKVMRGDITAEKQKQFVAEVTTLSRLHHSNLIDLIGYCQEGNSCILVYPFFRGGSLCARLHNTDGTRGRASRAGPVGPPLTLVERMCIAFQIAKGLRYLHTDVDPPIIHRDIKSSNVLLEDGSGANLRAVVADFGLARICESLFHTQADAIAWTSHVAGTQGYMAPEYLVRGKLTVKNDVYAFGVLLLELLTGRKVLTPAPPPEIGWRTLVQWVTPSLGRHLYVDDIPIQILDTCLREQVRNDAAMKRMVAGALLLARDCVEEVDSSRPTISAAAERMGSLLSGANVRGRANR